jgi:hypothetical protein
VPTNESEHRSNQSRRPGLKAALRDLAISVLFNAVCPYLLYRTLEPRFPAGSLTPLALCSVFPIGTVIAGYWRRRLVDIIGIFALVEVAVALIATAVANTPVAALLGRSLQNVVLSLLFLCSVAIGRPILFYLTRQLIAGKNDAHRARFDRVAGGREGTRVFRTETLVWAMALLVKSAISVVLAVSVSPTNYLLLAPSINYGLDILLVWWSFRYGYKKLGRQVAQDQALNVAARPVAEPA